MVVHLRMCGVSASGPIKLLQEFLTPYFVRTDGLLVLDVEFDLGTVEKRKLYTKHAMALAAKISDFHARNILFCISDHTDKTRGISFSVNTVARQFLLMWQ